MVINTVHLEDSKPVRISAELTVEEAAQMVKFLGRLAPATGATRETSAVYGALVGDVFNRYWDDGVDGYLRGDDE